MCSTFLEYNIYGITENVLYTLQILGYRVCKYGLLMWDGGEPGVRPTQVAARRPSPESSERGLQLSGGQGGLIGGRLAANRPRRPMVVRQGPSRAVVGAGGRPKLAAMFGASTVVAGVARVVTAARIGWNHTAGRFQRDSWVRAAVFWFLGSR